MKTESLWSRRHFIQGLGAAAAGTGGLGTALASSAMRSKQEVSFLYVGTASNTIEVMDVRSQHGRIIQRIPSEQPASLVIALDGKTLYAANRIASYRGLPMGTVEAYSIGTDGRLTLVHRQELSLAAKNPLHLALAPDGRSLVVTTESGIYNVLPVRETGIPDRASSILKVIGHEGQQLPEPRISTFDRAGRVLSADTGARRLRLFSAAEDGTMIHSHYGFAAARSPRHIAIHPSADALYITHDNGIACYSYDHGRGSLGDLRQNLDGIELNEGLRTVAIHPAGNLLAGCERHSGIVIWSVDPSNGTLRDRRHLHQELGRLDAIETSRSGAHVATMSQERGQIAILSVDHKAGWRSEKRVLGEVDSPRCLAMV